MLDSLNARGAIASRVLDDGRVIDVVPILFGQVRLGISADADSQVYDDVF